MRAGIAIALLTAGCTRILGVHDFPPEVIDTPVTCYGTMFPMCFDAPLPDPRTLTGAIDTDDVECRETIPDGAHGTSVCVIAATDLTIVDLRAHGSRPLVLIAQDQLTISGTLDISSHDGVVGPGGSSPACLPTTPGWGEDQETMRANAGGAGGSFGGAGGDGGNAQTENNTAGGGGRTNPVALGTALRGGCAGSSGGVPNGQAVMAGTYPQLAPAAGGAGGGAVLLVADAIEIDGAVDASGAGGAGGTYSMLARQVSTAGGGGGSGGLVAIDAAIVMVGGFVIANGGGGGSGGSRNGTMAGANGAPPLDAAAAGGFVNDPGSGTGGAGASRATAAKVGGPAQQSQDSGSGGGGGGVGRILSRVSIANASPPASPP